MKTQRKNLWFFEVKSRIYFGITKDIGKNIKEMYIHIRLLGFVKEPHFGILVELELPFLGCKIPNKENQ
jgi:hypothetical protein